jgi:hypothetical protein
MVPSGEGPENLERATLRRQKKCSRKAHVRLTVTPSLHFHRLVSPSCLGSHTKASAVREHRAFRLFSCDHQAMVRRYNRSKCIPSPRAESTAKSPIPSGSLSQRRTQGDLLLAQRTDGPVRNKLHHEACSASIHDGCVSHKARIGHDVVAGVIFQEPTLLYAQLDH